VDGHYDVGLTIIGSVYRETMTMEVTNRENHYLFDKTDDHYYKGLIKALSSLEAFLNTKQKKCLYIDLQFGGVKFDEAKFLQAVCETSIAAYLSSQFSSSFLYEPKVNPPKDVDCGFSSDGKTYNIEIKCPDFSVKNEIDSSNSFKIGSFGRLINFEEIVGNMQELFDPENNPSVEPDKPLIKQQHMDNKLKDYLLSAHNKFKDSTLLDELNVLVVCCSDWMDMQKWYFYMYGHQGLFTPESFHPSEDYKNVDVVMLSNLYHRHHEYWNKDKIEDHWDFSKSFNLVFSNPLRRSDKADIIWSFVDEVPNHSREIMNFKVPNGLEEMRIPHFVVEELIDKGLYYFQPNT
jgi:hypothetical protein